jgi:hypothetical protein
MPIKYISSIFKKIFLNKNIHINTTSKYTNNQSSLIKYNPHNKSLIKYVPHVQNNKMLKYNKNIK